MYSGADFPARKRVMVEPLRVAAAAAPATPATIPTAATRTSSFCGSPITWLLLLPSRSDSAIVSLGKYLSCKEIYLREERLSSRAELIEEVLAAMRHLSTEIDGLDQRAADRFGINRTDLQLIDVLRTSGPMTATELAKAVGLTSGGLSIAIDRLERVDYVHRYQHPNDRRRVIIEATETLEPLEREMFATLQQRFKKLLGRYTREQLLTIKHYLEEAAAITRETR